MKMQPDATLPFEEQCYVQHWIYFCQNNCSKNSYRVPSWRSRFRLNSWNKTVPYHAQCEQKCLQTWEGRWGLTAGGWREMHSSETAGQMWRCGAEPLLCTPDRSWQCDSEVDLHSCQCASACEPVTSELPFLWGEDHYFNSSTLHLPHFILLFTLWLMSVVLRGGARRVFLSLSVCLLKVSDVYLFFFFVFFAHRLLLAVVSVVSNSEGQVTTVRFFPTDVSQTWIL